MQIEDERGKKEALLSKEQKERKRERERERENKKKERERRERQRREQTEKTTWVHTAPRYSHASASDVISPADRAASTAYPGSHRIITRKMAHYYHYYFIFPPLQRGPETTEKQKISEININKSSGHRAASVPTEKIPEDGKSNREKRGE